MSAILSKLGLSKAPSKPNAPTKQATEHADFDTIAKSFAARLETAFALNGDYTKITSLFTEDGYLRDVMALQWRFRTLHGQQAIQSFFESIKMKSSAVYDLHVEDDSAVIEESIPGTPYIRAFFRFQTPIGTGRGCFRLTHDKGEHRASMVYFSLEELKGFKERKGSTRPRGVEHAFTTNRTTWVSRRAREKDFQNTEPEVVVVGAGQGGLTVAARLQQFGVKTLILEKNARVGDNWRQRYDFLVLHDPVWYNHMPHIPFPPHWPIFTPKDKLASWFEAYVDAMELNVWTGACLGTTSYDDATGQWTVQVTRSDGEKRLLHPKHVVLASGHSGEPNVPQFKGSEIFHGEIFHSSQHTTGKNFSGKKAVVIGCCNSGHDIAQDLHEHGCDVTMVQRSSTYVISSEAVVKVLFDGIYCEGGPPIEDADLIMTSQPVFVQKEVGRHLTSKIKSFDQKLLDGLTAAGFKLDFGPDDSGFLIKYLNRGGGYYLDVACSQLIADGKIKIKQGQEVSHFNQKGVVFADGEELEADLVVVATGYKNMRTTAERIFGKEVSERTHDVWGLNEEGEIQTMWQDSGHSGFYYMGGNLALSRYYSRHLALLILSRLRGIV